MLSKNAKKPELEPVHACFTLTHSQVIALSFSLTHTYTHMHTHTHSHSHTNTHAHTQTLTYTQVREHTDKHVLIITKLRNIYFKFNSFLNSFFCVSLSDVVSLHLPESLIHSFHTLSHSYIRTLSPTHTPT